MNHLYRNEECCQVQSCLCGCEYTKQRPIDYKEESYLPIEKLELQPTAEHYLERGTCPEVDFEVMRLKKHETWLEGHHAWGNK